MVECDGASRERVGPPYVLEREKPIWIKHVGHECHTTSPDTDTDTDTDTHTPHDARRTWALTSVASHSSTCTPGAAGWCGLSGLRCAPGENHMQPLSTSTSSIGHCDKFAFLKKEISRSSYIFVDNHAKSHLNFFIISLQVSAVCSQLQARDVRICAYPAGCSTLVGQVEPIGLVLVPRRRRLRVRRLKKNTSAKILSTDHWNVRSHRSTILGTRGSTPVIITDKQLNFKWSSPWTAACQNRSRYRRP